MHCLSVALWTLLAASANAWEQRSYLRNFEDLDFANNDAYAALPIGVYGGLNFGSSFALFTVGENNTATGGVTLASPSQVAIYTLRRGSTGRLIETRATEDFVPDTFELHSLSLGCTTLDANHQPTKPVGCSVTIKGFYLNSQSAVIAQQTMHFKPLGQAQVPMKRVKLNKSFKGLRYLLLDMTSKFRSGETMVLIDDISVTINGTARAME